MAVGVAGACVGGTDGAERAFELSCEVVVLPSAAMFAGELPNLLVVLAGAAILTGNGFGGLADLIVVLAGAAIVATGYVIIVVQRSICPNWASFAGGCVRKWVQSGLCHECTGGTTS